MFKFKPSSASLVTKQLPRLRLHHLHSRSYRATSLLQKSNPTTTTNTMSENPRPSVQRSNEEWRSKLSPEQYRVLRLQATEPAYTGAYDKHYPEHGMYTCAGCSAPLYKAEQKFDSGCGWPAYYDSVDGAVARRPDGVLTEALCKQCGGHLGHVFVGEGFKTPTDVRHCINSSSLLFRGEKGDSEGISDETR